LNESGSTIGLVKGRIHQSEDERRKVLSEFRAYGMEPWTTVEIIKLGHAHAIIVENMESGSKKSGIVRMMVSEFHDTSQNFHVYLILFSQKVACDQIEWNRELKENDFWNLFSDRISILKSKINRCLDLLIFSRDSEVSLLDNFCSSLFLTALGKLSS
jgi:hypothetical protein